MEWLRTIWVFPGLPKYVQSSAKDNTAMVKTVEWKNWFQIILPSLSMYIQNMLDVVEKV